MREGEREREWEREREREREREEGGEGYVGTLGDAHSVRR